MSGERSGKREARQRQPSSPGRRRFLQAAGAGIVLAPAFLRGVRADGASGSDLFTLGVASGDPSATSVVLWTRLAPEPLDGGGMGPRPVPVRWQVALDPGMGNVIRDGLTIAFAERGHSVHVVASGLPPARWLYYRFHALGCWSRIGRTRTFPAPGQVVDHVRFAVANCQNYQDGFFPAFADMAGQELDFVVHLGDYIYESGATASPIAPGRVHTGAEAVSVEDYRNRYALYRLDRDLQDAHAQFPFVVTWDDHEVDNNYAAHVAEEGAPIQGAEFLERRRNAYRAYGETMPLRPLNRLLDTSGRLRLYRSLAFGDLAKIFMLDTRQFASDQPCDDLLGSTDPDSVALEPLLGTLFCPDEILDPAATKLGAAQARWLARSLLASRGHWNVLAQGTMLTEWNLGSLLDAVAPGLQIDTLYLMDAWDGYKAAQGRLLRFLEWLRPSNPVVLTGDIHCAWCANLLADFSEPESDVVAVEFVTTSISSTLGLQNPVVVDAAFRASARLGNPHIEFYNGLFRGYSICDVDRGRWRTIHRAVGTLDDVEAARADPSAGNLALTPFEGDPVDTDAVVEVASGFNERGAGSRLETVFARFPLIG